MPESIVLTHKDPSILPWVVPVPVGQSPEQVAALYEISGWSLAEGVDAAEVAADLAARVPPPAPAPVPAPDVVPAPPVITDPAPADVTNPEGNPS